MSKENPIRIFAKHPPYKDGHLGEVALDMEHAGSPTIRVVRFEGEFYALEGSHRLALAHENGLVPKIVLLDADSEGCDDFYRRIRTTLPVYEFEHVLLLEESTFYLRMDLPTRPAACACGIHARIPCHIHSDPKEDRGSPFERRK